MSNDTVPAARATGGLATGTWRLDPARSSVEFHVPHFYGLMTVTGRFDRYQGSAATGADPHPPPTDRLVGRLGATPRAHRHIRARIRDDRTENIGGPHA
jgi:hypothetical protein